MPDGVSIHIESLPMERALKMWKRELGKAYPDFLRSESKKALKQIIKDTPIFKLAPKRKEVSSDLRNTVGTIDVGKIRNPRLRDLLTKRDFSTLNRVFQRIPAGPFKNKRVVAFDKSMHRPFTAGFRKVRGKPSDRLTPDKAQWKRFRKDLWLRLGFMKAGWTQSARKLGVKIPSYAKRHSAAHASSDYYEKFSDNESFVEMTNRKIKFRESSIKFLIERALFRRARSMEGLLRRVVSGKAAKVGFTTQGGTSSTVIFNE